MRKVALKIIKPGMDTHEVIARFEAERQALALMDHPNIARVLDAGVDGHRPAVLRDGAGQGRADHRVLRPNDLSTEERLKLFIDVCQRGAARSPEGDHPPRHQALEHPGDAARRQAGAEGHRLRRRQGDQPAADGKDAVHGLRADDRHAAVHEPGAGGDERPGRGHAERRVLAGVLLYELLTGTTPLEGERLRTAGYAEMQRMIREEDPPRPSVRLSTLGERLTVVAKHRSTDPKRLRQLIRGDLDWIVMKSLEKERGRRYESADSFAADVERFLSGQAGGSPSAFHRVSSAEVRPSLPATGRRRDDRPGGTLGGSRGNYRGYDSSRAVRQGSRLRQGKGGSLTKRKGGAGGGGSPHRGKGQSLTRNGMRRQRVEEEAARKRRLLYIADMGGAREAWALGRPETIGGVAPAACSAGQ